MSSWSASSDEIRSSREPVGSSGSLTVMSILSSWKNGCISSATVPPVFPRYSGGSPEGLRSGRHPRFLPDRCGLFVKNGLAIYFCFYITGRRVNFSHLRVFIHIRTLRPRGLVRILTADAVFFASLAEICDVIFSLIGFEYDIFLSIPSSFTRRSSIGYSSCR